MNHGDGNLFVCYSLH